MGAVVDWIAERGLREFLDLCIAIGAAIAGYAGVQNRRELRNGLGVTRTKRRRKQDARKVMSGEMSPAEAADSELPLRALVETALRSQDGFDRRLERMETMLEVQRDEDKQARAGDLDRRHDG